MKLLRTYDQAATAEIIAAKFRDQGILLHISGAHSNHLGTAVTGNTQVSVWVVLDSQFEDAAQLLTNDTYVVKNPLSREKLIELEKGANTNLDSSLSSISLGILFFAILVAAAIYLVVKN